jgi:hypothetical protein
MPMPWTQTPLGSGHKAQIGRVGTARVWYRGARYQGGPVPDEPWRATVFGITPDSGFTNSDDAKAWCEKSAKTILEAALNDLNQR